MVRRTRTIAERNNESSRRRATKSEEKDEPKERGEERSIEVETRQLLVALSAIGFRFAYPISTVILVVKRLNETSPSLSLSLFPVLDLRFEIHQRIDRSSSSRDNTTRDNFLATRVIRG